MAVTTAQNFVIKINVKNAASGDLNKLANDSAAVNVQTQALERQMAILTEALRNANASVMTLSNGYTTAATSTAALATSSAQSNVPLKEQATLFQQLGSAVKSTTDFVRGGIQTFSQMVVIFDAMSKKENLQKISNLMNVLALVAKVKGHGEIAKELQVGAEKVMLLSDKLEDFKHKTEEVFPVALGHVQALDDGLTALREGAADNFEGLADSSKAGAHRVQHPRKRGESPSASRSPQRPATRA
jgi:hypothetical protein